MLGRSFIKIKNTKGLRKEPCGTLDVTFAVEDEVELNEMNLERELRKLAIQSISQRLFKITFT